MLKSLEETFSKTANLTKIPGHKTVSVFNFYSLTDASFNLFLTAIPSNTLPILPPYGQKDFKNTSKSEILMCQILSKMHRENCLSQPYR